MSMHNVLFAYDLGTQIVTCCGLVHSESITLTSCPVATFPNLS